MTIEIMADANCKACRGTGLIMDWVDYGSTQVSMPAICDCIFEQVPEGLEDAEIIIVEAGNSWEDGGGVPIPFDGQPVPCEEWADDYGLEAMA